MNNKNYQQYERRMEQFNANSRQNQYSTRILRSELLVQKLQMQNTSLIQNIQAAEQQIASLRDTLGNIIPENEQLKSDIISMKQLIEQYQQQSGTQLAQKQRIIQQLSEQIATLNNRQEMRKSDLSSMGQLTKSISDKNRLQEEIQQLKKQTLTDHENYQQMLVKKDQIIKDMNEQYSQLQTIITGKITLIKNMDEKNKSMEVQKNYMENQIKSMENQINYLKNQLATTKHQLTTKDNHLMTNQQQNKHLSDQVQKLTNIMSQMRDQLQTKHQTSSTELSSYKQQLMLLKKECQQSSRQTRQFQSQNQSLYNQNQQILKQYQSVKQENMQQKQQLFTVKLQLQALEQQSRQLTQQNKYLLQCLQQTRKQQYSNNNLNQLQSPNISQQIQLKQHYLSLLEQSRKELSHNQVQLKNTFIQLQNKASQIKMKQNQITQLKLSINNYKHYHAYFQNSNKELEQDKTGLLNKLMEKDAQVRSYQSRVEELTKQIYKIRKRIEQLQVTNKQLAKEKQQIQYSLRNQQQTPITVQQKNSPIQHFYDCNNQKQLLHEQLKQTKKTLLQQKHKSESYLSQVYKLKHQLQLIQKHNQSQQTSPNKPFNSPKPLQDYESRIHQLKEENRLLAERLNERTHKLQQKTKRLQKIQSTLKAQYQTRIKSLQQQIYKLTIIDEQQSQTSPRKPSTVPQLQKTDDLLIDDLDNQFQLQLQKDHELPPQAIHNQLHQYNHLNTQSNKKLLSTDELPKSKQSLSSQTDRPYKIMYEQLRVQNDSLQAHLERLSGTLSETKERLTQKQNEIRKVQQGQTHNLGGATQQQTQEHLRKIRQLQRQLTQAKQQLQRFQSLKQLLKLQKSQSKQKSTLITQLQQTLKRLQKCHKQLKQDYHNLQTLNEQTNQKYKKTLDQFQKQINHMNDQIFKEKSLIDDKKKQMKRLQNEYIGKLNLYQDDNMALRSKIKKLQLCNIKLQQHIKQLQEDHIQKVIITRTQLVNYKQTEKRLQQLEEQINILSKDKDKFINEKKSLELYYTEELSLLRVNFGNQREKLLRKITQLQEIKSQLSLKLEKTKEILENKRKQTYELQQSLERTSKQNYHIKLQLSSTLTQINTQLLKNKTLAQNIQQLQNQINDIKISYQGLVVEKSKNQKQKLTKNGYKVQLQMAYKQIQKLNDLLMDKEKQINHYLLNHPTSDNYNIKGEHLVYAEKDNKYTGDIRGGPHHDDATKQFASYYQANRPRKASRQYTYSSENPFTQPQHSQSHYKSTKNIYPKQTDFVKQTTTQFRQTHDPRTSTQNPQNPEGHYQRKTSQQQQFTQPNERFIGGFPLKYCTFAPEYHKI